MRAAIYVRVSDQKQEDGTSLDTQEEACRKFAADQGWTVTEGHIYREVYSGAYLDRPQFDRLRAAIDRRELDRVVVWHSDRFGRDPDERVYLRVEAKRRGVRYVSVTNPREDTAEGRLVDYIEGYAASVERQSLIRRTQEGTRKRVESGKRLVGCKPVYGYAWADDVDAKGRPVRGRLVEDPITAAVVRRIFALAATGTALRRIADDLIRDGVPTPKDRRGADGAPAWRHRSVHAILTNPVYRGVSLAYVHRLVEPASGGGRKTSTQVRPEAEWVRLPDGTAPALVDASTWDRVQARLTVNRERSERSSSPKHDALLRGGLVRCAHCGAAMSVSHREGRTARYVCPADKRHPDCGKRGHSILVTKLDPETWRWARLILNVPTIMEHELSRMIEQDTTEADLAVLDRSLAALNKQESNIAGAIAMLGDNLAAAESLVRKLSDLATQRTTLRAEREQAAGQRAAQQAALDRIDALEAWRKDIAAGVDRLDYEGRRDVLERLGVRVRVYRQGTREDGVRYEWSMYPGSADGTLEGALAAAKVGHVNGALDGLIRQTVYKTAFGSTTFRA
ncbi:MAG: recombinase family protein [Chloroflexota bacterium]|nr:recombinase family protein [Chloroflexota bacterium]